MALQALSTDTAAQQTVSHAIGSTAATERSTIQAFLDEVQAMQSTFQGETAQATQTKAAHLHEVGIKLTQHLDSISERVGHAAGGYINVDSDGASSVASSGSTAF